MRKPFGSRSVDEIKDYSHTAALRPPMRLAMSAPLEGQSRRVNQLQVAAMHRLGCLSPTVRQDLLRSLTCHHARTMRKDQSEARAIYGISPGLGRHRLFRSPSTYRPVRASRLREYVRALSVRQLGSIAATSKDDWRCSEFGRSLGTGQRRSVDSQTVAPILENSIGTGQLIGADGFCFVIMSKPYRNKLQGG